MTKQHCPYCHFEEGYGKNMAVNTDDEIYLAVHGGEYYLDITADTRHLSRANPFTELFSINLSYCPKCGRKLS